MAYPDDGGLLLWSAVLSQMLWRDNVALNDVRQVSRMQNFDGVSREELMGWIGDLLFRTGSYAESLPYVDDGTADPPGRDP